MDNEINRGELARQVLENPMYREAITATKARLFNDWANTKWFQVRKREKIWRMYRAAEAVDSYIAKTLNTGKMARISQEQRDKLKSVV